MTPPPVNLDSTGKATRHAAQPGAAQALAAGGSFLGALPAATLERIARLAEFQSKAPRTLLFRAGDPAADVYLVLEGSVSLFGLAAEGREVSLDIVQPVEMLAPWAALANLPHTVSARAIGQARLACLPAAAVRAELGRDHVLARVLLAEMCRRMRALMAQIEDLKLRTTIERVGHYLLSLGPTDDGGTALDLPISKQLIASQLGMTPESLSRAFAALRAHGVAISGNHVTIGDPAALRELCRPGD